MSKRQPNQQTICHFETSALPHGAAVISRDRKDMSAIITCPVRHNQGGGRTFIYLFMNGNRNKMREMHPEVKFSPASHAISHFHFASTATSPLRESATKHHGSSEDTRISAIPELEVPPRWCEDFGCRPSFADWRHLAVMS